MTVRAETSTTATPSAPRAAYRKATASSDLLAELLPAWRLTLRMVPRDYFDRFLVRNGPRVEAAFGRLLGQIAVRRYLAARWPPDDAYFLRHQWKQELRFEGNTAKARALAQEYKRQTNHEPGEGVEHRAGEFRAEWLSGDDEVSIQGPVTLAVQRMLLARYGFARRGSEHVQAWLPGDRLRAGQRGGRAAIAVWTRATHAVDKLASGDYGRPSTRKR
jgi:hypothetical protein